jgi:hypothetical protein
MPSFIQKAVSVIRLRRIRLVVSKTSLIANMIQTIQLRRINIIASMKQIMGFISTISLRIPITFISKATQKLVSTIALRRIRIIADPIIAAFFILGDYDPLTLGDLDGETLGDLDYVES